MTLLILGASSDMGVALITSCAEKYDVILAHYYHMNDKLQALKDTYGDKIVLLQADLSSSEDLDRLVGEISAMDVSVDHVVHFPAQQIKLIKFAKTSWEVFERGYDISVKSLVFILQAILPKMAKKKHGRIVVMLSDAVLGVPPKYSSDYVMHKYTLLGLVKALAVEYAEKGITVNGVSPSFVETKFVEGMADMIKEEHRAKSPLGRNLTPKDVVPTIEMLLSEDAACINGQNIPINFGM